MDALEGDPVVGGPLGAPAGGDRVKGARGVAGCCRWGRHEGREAGPSKVCVGVTEGRRGGKGGERWVDGFHGGQRWVGG